MDERPDMLTCLRGSGQDGTKLDECGDGEFLGIRGGGDMGEMGRARRAKTRMRLERDMLGRLEVPFYVLYGIQTARAVENYPISGYR